MVIHPLRGKGRWTDGRGERSHSAATVPTSVSHDYPGPSAAFLAPRQPHALGAAHLVCARV